MYLIFIGGLYSLSMIASKSIHRMCVDVNFRDTRIFEFVHTGDFLGVLLAHIMWLKEWIMIGDHQVIGVAFCSKAGFSFISSISSINTYIPLPAPF